MNFHWQRQAELQQSLLDRAGLHVLLQHLQTRFQRFLQVLSLCKGVYGQEMPVLRQKSVATAWCACDCAEAPERGAAFG